MKETMMTFGEKVREARKMQGLSQEELAKKLCVSRPAVTKWENGGGMPDIENLKMISKLLDVSLDYLLADSMEGVSHLLKQTIDLSSYPQAQGNALKEDAVMLEYYPDAEHIWQLSRERKLSTKEKVFDLIFPRVNYTVDHWQDPSIYYLVEKKGVQHLVNVTKDFIISQKLVRNITDNTFALGEQMFRKTRRKIK